MLQVSTEVESEEEVEVSLEQAVKATNAAINNAFFILVCLSFIFLVLLAGIEPARTLLPTGF